MSVDLKKQALVERMTLAAQLTIEKTLAHMDDPGHYPLPADPKSPERALIAHLIKISADRRDISSTNCCRCSGISDEVRRWATSLVSTSAFRSRSLPRRWRCRPRRR
jgi:hypothetical protein